MSISSRKTLLVCLTALCISVLLIVGCSSPHFGAEYTFEGGAVTSENDELKVDLDSNPTTGYQWNVSIDGSGIKLVNSEYETQDTKESDGLEDILGQPGENSPVMGAGGTESFEFRGTGAGEQTITFTYERSFETNGNNRQLILKTTTNNQGYIIASEMTENGQKLGSSEHK